MWSLGVNMDIVRPMTPSILIEVNAENSLSNRCGHLRRVSEYQEHVLNTIRSLEFSWF